MWYTVMLDGTPIGGVELPAAGICAGRMMPLPGYLPVRTLIAEATAAMLQVGLFGAPPLVPPFPAERLRLRRILARAARLEWDLIEASGAVADTSFISLLEPPGDHRVVVVAGFTLASAFVGATRSVEPIELPGGA